MPGERALLQPAWQPAEGMLPWYPVVHCVQKKRELGKKKKKKPDFIHCLAGKIGKCQLHNHWK